jgi:hypothetical protein
MQTQQVEAMRRACLAGNEYVIFSPTLLAQEGGHQYIRGAFHSPLVSTTRQGTRLIARALA